MGIALAIAFMVLVAQRGATNVAAYAAGREAPDIEKFRRRQDQREAKRLDKRTNSGKQPGPVRKIVRAVGHNTAEELVQRAGHASQRRQQWFAETAPERDAKWRAKKSHKLNKQRAAIERFARRHEITVETGVLGGGHRAEQSDPAAEQQKQQKPEPAGSGPVIPREQLSSTPPPAPSTVGGADVTNYETAAQELEKRAQEVEQYQQELATMGDVFASKGWGAEVTGGLSDVSAPLTRAAGHYYEQAAEIRRQGQAVQDAYERAPWAPDKDEVLN